MDELISEAAQAGENETTLAGLQLQKASNALIANQFDVAEKAAEQALTLNATTENQYRIRASALLAKARSLTGQYQFEAAETAFEQSEAALMALPGSNSADSYDLEFALAVLALRRSDYRRAMTRAESALEHAIALGANGLAERRATAFLIADLHLLARAPQMSLNVLAEIDHTSLEPQDSTRWQLSKARALVMTGDMDQALQVLEQAASSNSDLPAACQWRPTAQLERIRGEIYFFRRAPAEAERAFRASRVALANTQGEFEEEKATLNYYLGFTAQLQGDYDRAITLFEEALARFAEIGSTNVDAIATIETATAIAYAEIAQGDKALALANSALVKTKASRPDGSWPIGHAYAGIGFASAALGDIEAAETAFSKAFEIFESVGGEVSGDIPPGLVVLGELALKTEQFDKAQAFFERAIEIQSNEGWLTGIGAARSYSLLAETQRRAGNLARARESSARAVSILETRLSQSSGVTAHTLIAEQKVAREIFLRDLRLINSPTLNRAAEPATIERTFRLMQLANGSRTGQSLAQSASLLEDRDPVLGELVSEYRALIERRRRLELDQTMRLLTSSQPSNNAANGSSADTAILLDQRLTELRIEIDTIDPTLFDNLNTEPLKLADVQRAMRPGEALCLIILDETQSYVFLVFPESEALYVRNIGEADIVAHLQTLRDVMDPQRWERQGPYPPYPAEIGADLFDALLEPVEARVPAGDRIYFVKDGQLGGFPLGALLTNKPDTAPAPATYPTWPWLVKRNIIANVPSAKSFVTLRQSTNETSDRDDRFLGVGAPVLNGIVSASRSSRVSLDEIWAGPLASPDALHRLGSLPNAEAELENISKVFGQDRAETMIGPKATEAALRARSLVGFSVISFATHGLASGGMSTLSEPGIVMTPPDAPTRADDGFLTVSEVSQLQMDAEIVLLSACTTAATDGSFDGEPLSGLARAFFLAGAQSIIATHWDADDASTRFFMEGTVQQIVNDVRPSEAANRAQIVRLGDLSLRSRTHPSTWAPYEYVGAD